MADRDKGKAYLSDYDLIFSRYNQPQYYTCRWCNANAMKMITRWLPLSEQWDTAPICDWHIREIELRSPGFLVRE